MAAPTPASRCFLDAEVFLDIYPIPWRRLENMLSEAREFQQFYSKLPGLYMLILCDTTQRHSEATTRIRQCGACSAARSSPVALP